ncbi:hypothetical protein M434DRAFT_31442 [Hypoxylon sp. CO27-5]|nr:hypothetical protein M434DRAFT_31442 [Hypoxylon sp. CO27-5]
MYEAISGFSTSVSNSSTEVIAAAPIRTLTPWTPARAASPTLTTNISSTPVPSTTTTRACSVTDVCDYDECSPECCDNGACEITRSSPTPDS